MPMVQKVGTGGQISQRGSQRQLANGLYCAIGTVSEFAPTSLGHIYYVTRALLWIVAMGR